jgi:predicted HTH domain antitoxin
LGRERFVFLLCKSPAVVHLHIVVVFAKDYFKRGAIITTMVLTLPEKRNHAITQIKGDPILKTIETELHESTAGIIDELADDFHIGRSAMLARIIEEGVQAELVKRSIRLYAGGKVSMWRAAQMAGLSFYEMATEMKKHGVPLQYGVEDFEADVKTLRKLKSDI